MQTKRIGLLIAAALTLAAQDPPAITPPEPAQKKQASRRPPRPGVSTPGVKREMASVTPLAVFDTGGTPDWQVVTNDGVWVCNGPTNTVHRLDAASNKIGA